MNNLNVGDKVKYTGCMQLIGTAPFRIFYLFPLDGQADIVSKEGYDFRVNLSDLILDEDATNVLQTYYPAFPGPFYGDIKDVPPPVPKCDCGGEKHGWAHSDWCDLAQASK